MPSAVSSNEEEFGSDDHENHRDFDKNANLDLSCADSGLDMEDRHQLSFFQIHECNSIDPLHLTDREIPFELNLIRVMIGGLEMSLQMKVAIGWDYSIS